MSCSSLQASDVGSWSREATWYSESTTPVRSRSQVWRREMFCNLRLHDNSSILDLYLTKSFKGFRPLLYCSRARPGRRNQRLFLATSVECNGTYDYQRQCCEGKACRLDTRDHVKLESPKVPLRYPSYAQRLAFKSETSISWRLLDTRVGSS